VPHIRSEASEGCRAEALRAKAGWTDKGEACPA